MTPKEALHILSNTKICFARGNGKTVYFGALAKAAEALENAERYKWHDLRKNPKDTPNGNERYYVARFDYVTNTIFYDILWYEKDTWWNRRYTGDFAVIAWRYIEPFEEVEE